MSHGTDPEGSARQATRSLGAILLWGLVGGLSIAGCETDIHRQANADWAILCDQAPYGAGQEISAKEQRAMTRLGAWTLSVEELNQQCQSR